jgi:acyl carrier protein
MENKEKIRNFIARNTRRTNVADGDDIFALGLVNSMFAMQLVLFIERDFGFKVENEDLDLANFRSTDAISALVARKTGGG